MIKLRKTILKMYILKIAPTIKLPLNQPQLLTYFSKNNLEIGSLVKIRIKNKKVLGVVFEKNDLQSAKMSLRKASSYSVKGIEEIVFPGQVFDEKARALLLWASAYYYEPLGIVLKSALPHFSMTAWQKMAKRALVKISYSKKDENFRKEFCPHMSIAKIKTLCSYALTKGQQILIFYPELLKLEQAYQKLAQEIKGSVFSYHSRTKAQRVREIWFHLNSGKPAIILTTKSGAFLPFKNLSFILVAEEDSDAHKSWDQHPKINFKHLALKLSELHQARIILSSPTPSLETYWNVLEKKYLVSKEKLLKLSAIGRDCRVFQVDMKNYLEHDLAHFSYFSPAAQKKIFSLSCQKKPIKLLFFQNRRGGATYVFCADCGYGYQCPKCSFSLNYHYQNKKLLCHWCGHKEEPPTECRRCQGHRLKYAGYGTQKIYHQAQILFPELRFYILDNDIAPNPEDKKIIWKNFLNIKKPAALIATNALFAVPMIKFNLALFLNFDLLLSFADYRAQERCLKTYAKIKIMSRNLIIQSYQTDDPFFKELLRNSYGTMLKKELALRKLLNYPPFWQMVNLTFRHRNKVKARTEAVKLANLLKRKAAKSEDVLVLGPILPLRSKLKNYYYQRIILKLKRGSFKKRNALLAHVPVNWDIDIDPVDF